VGPIMLPWHDPELHANNSITRERCVLDRDRASCRIDVLLSYLEK
jgi:hypothetical protein